MELSITARHIEIADSVKEYLKKRLNKLKKYFKKKEVNIHVVFMAEKERRGIEVTLDYNGILIHSQETTEDIYTSIDQVVEKLERQLKKYKEKIQKKPRVPSKIIPEMESSQTLEGKTVRRKKQTLKPMTLEEAIIQLEQTSLDFLVFTDAQTDAINVLYRCKDGNYGLIEPGGK
ncbi:MAG: ribosome-associated translation inhibitor RaiA [bacterium]